ncbi:MAG: aconitate hydratase AcnA [Kiritimatiellae bacterium]|nr:aconitate hydratase AcnA [Kiritimatiellia bacterium]
MKPFEYSLKKLTLSTGTSYFYYDLHTLENKGLGAISKFPFSLKILLESLLRMQSHPAYTEEHVTEFCEWQPGKETRREFPYMPARVLLQDFTGVPCVVDLAALRSTLERAGQDPSLIEPQIPVDLVIDHSVQIDDYGKKPAFDYNLEKEFERNKERYSFLHWGQNAFKKLNVLPPGLGICHQVNMEYLGSCITSDTDDQGQSIAFPDTLVGTDSHTTMINSMGILGWGVGGIEAEAAMLGQPIPLLTPIVIGVRIAGEMQSGVTPTDIALAITQMLREKGVVGHFVEFFGSGLDHLSLADRAPIANMSPEYGATMGYFPIDDNTLKYLRTTSRSEKQIELVERYCKEQGLFRTSNASEPEYDQVVELDLSTVESSVAGPKRPQDRVLVKNLHTSFNKGLTAPVAERGFGLADDQVDKTGSANPYGTLTHGSVVIAAITSCTNTSNPSLLIGAGLVAKKATERGLAVPAYVKTSLAPGSRVVTEYLKRAALLPYLETLGFHVVAYGCTTCIGNSGPLRPEIETAIKENDLVVAAALSGNRNFEGRIHPLTKANYLCSPPLVVAYALKGSVEGDLLNDPLGADTNGQPVYLKDIWPTREEIESLLDIAFDPTMYRTLYEDVMNASPTWNEISSAKNAVYPWEPTSTYIQEPSFFEDLEETPQALEDITNASILGYYGDFVTTDHISPAGAIALDGPAAKYLIKEDVQPEAFNSFGSRRGNHEVMMRGTFANIRIRNKLVDKEGGWTVYHPTSEETSIYDAAMKYKETKTPLVVVAGKLYGAGSSRDWAAKGTFLLGVKAVLAESFERIHRSNLVEMGVLPLEFVENQNAETLKLTGKEQITITGIADNLQPVKLMEVIAKGSDGNEIFFNAKCRIDTPIEVEYYQHGGILQYVLRDVMRGRDSD